MTPQYTDISTITALHDFYNYGKPKHPLITVIYLDDTSPNRPEGGGFFKTGFYSVYCKRFNGELKYGKSYYDFDEGSLMFTAPQQVVAVSGDTSSVKGWGLFFHPDLLNRSGLGSKIHEYSFFNYDVNEALHISDDENKTLMDCLANIEKECANNIDRHTQQLLIDNLQLLLNYCSRFYDRQFFTRAKVNNDIVQKFERLMTNYFLQDTLIEVGIPDVKYFASALHFSPGYLSDLLQKYTGKTTQEHIHLAVTEKAKYLLLGTAKPVSEIAYELGFEHPSHFTKLFKNKTGVSPKEYRGLN